MMKKKQNLLPLQEKQVDLLFEIVERVTGVGRKLAISKDRRRFIVDARKMMIGLLRKEINLTCYQVGQVLNMDHSTVLYNERMHNVHMMEKEFRRVYSCILGTFLIDAAVQAEKDLQDKFAELELRTSLLLDSIANQRELIHSSFDDYNEKYLTKL
tara:strand:- start:395 stop:862 length:468 start_codon:yes stop_codon:yes gene_type:complete